MHSVPKPTSSKLNYVPHPLNYVLTALSLKHTSAAAAALPTRFPTLSSTFAPTSADKTSVYSLRSFGISPQTSLRCPALSLQPTPNSFPGPGLQASCAPAPLSRDLGSQLAR